VEHVLPVDLAVRLKEAGLSWKPAPGDRFAVPDRDLDEDVFVFSGMTIEVHELPDGPVIGFNGTTEWALDDIDQADAVWLPREDQLRELLGGTFRGLDRTDEGYRVALDLPGGPAAVTAPTAEQAYGEALLHLIRRGAS
jgi:hypothetical protein